MEGSYSKQYVVESIDGMYNEDIKVQEERSLDVVECEVSQDMRYCDECDENIATKDCDDCGLVYCTHCDTHRHRKGKLLFHQRKDIEKQIISQIEVENKAYYWDVPHVLEWLDSIELNVFNDEFIFHNIDGKILTNNKEMELIIDGMKSKSRGLKKKLLREIQKLVDNSKIIPDSNVNSSIQFNNLNSLDTKNIAKDLRLNSETMQLEGNRRLNLQVDIDTKPLCIDPGNADFNTQHGHLSPHYLPESNEIKSISTTQRENLAIKIVENVEHHIPHMSRRLKVGQNLKLDLQNLKVETGKVEKSFDFSAEGRLQTQGFDIDTHGITNFPSQFGHKSVKVNNLEMDEKICGSEQHIGKRLRIREWLVTLNELGHGASGKVFKALYIPTFKFVAIKVIRVFDQKKRHQMIRELKSLHVNAVPISIQQDSNSLSPVSAACDELVMFYDAYTNPDIGSVSIVLEFMNSGSLEEVMNNSLTRLNVSFDGRHESTLNTMPRYRTEEELAKLAYSVLRGLKFLHDHKQLHRDIKLSNILVNSRGQVKISDFGISRDLDNTLAQASTFTGTFLYMAPERINGGSYSYPSDIWSFGLALLTMTIRRLPVSTKNGYWGVVHSIRDEPSPSLRDYFDEFPNFSEPFIEFIDLCLEKNPHNRPTADQLLNHKFIQSHMDYISQAQTSYTSNEDNELLSIPDEHNDFSRAHTELNEIAFKVEQWYQENGHLLHDKEAHSNVNNLSFRNNSIDMKVKTLADQLGIPIDIVAKKFSFLYEYECEVRN